MTTYKKYRTLISTGGSTERLVFFSDAVFAIAMTLLVVELKVPQVPHEELGAALVEMIPEFGSFVLSFVVVGMIWMSHHRKFRAITGYTQTLIRINLLMLLVVASLPFTTSLLGRYGDDRLSVYVYGATIAAIGFLMSALWIYAWHKKLVSPEVTVDVFRYVLVQSFSIPGIFLLSIPVAVFAGATVAEITWIAAVPVSLIINRIYRATTA
ncbi:MAG: DUF1211 domain-containing protein [Cryobacterium sp.]|nr:DUF1211 domain-containing protein [Cryobacterium sp.]